MTKTRSKSRSKATWTQDQLNKAFKLVDEGKSIREAARSTGLPFSTLQERLKNKNQEIPQLGRNPVFSAAQENEMASQIKFLANIFYGCTPHDIRKMAYEYAEKNKIKHNFNNTLGLAGKDWLKNFMNRNHLSTRKAEGTSLNRATAFNKQEVGIFFQNLLELMEKYKFPPKNIYNVDETGISSVQDPGKIVTEKGQRRVGSITSGERGNTITAVCAMNATGVYVPPMLIYPRQRHSSALETDGPRGAIYKCSKNGWINEDLFIDWLKHFAGFAKPSENELILLILDNHSSHISLRAYEFCKTNHIVMLSLPPHGSHRIQPMDVSIYGPLKAAYKQECNLFMKTQLGRKITQNDIASLFRKAFQKVATIPKAEAGFSATGIYPPNPDIFTDEDFLAAEILNNDDMGVSREQIRDRDNRTPDNQAILSPEATNPIPSTSGVKTSILAKDLLPIPKNTIGKNRQSRKQHSIIITGSPNKEALVQKENKKMTREKKKETEKTKIEKKTKTKRNPKSVNVRKAKKRVFQEIDKNCSTTSDSEIEMKDLYEDNDTDADDDSKNKCIICDDYGQNNELWYRCVICGLWAHAECSGYDSPKDYMCDLCLNKA